MTTVLEPLVLSAAAQDLLFREARTANSFSAEAVTEPQLEAIYALVTSAPVTAILAYDLDFHEQLPVVFPHLPQAKDDFADEESRHAIGRSNAMLQAGYFIVGVRAAGLAAGPMAGFDADAVNAEFFPDGRTKAVVAVNIGHPGENPWFGRNPRLAYEDVVTVL